MHHMCMKSDVNSLYPYNTFDEKMKMIADCRMRKFKIREQKQMDLAVKSFLSIRNYERRGKNESISLNYDLLILLLSNRYVFSFYEQWIQNYLMHSRMLSSCLSPPLYSPCIFCHLVFVLAICIYLGEAVLFSLQHSLSLTISFSLSAPSLLLRLFRFYLLPILHDSLASMHFTSNTKILCCI